MTNKLSFTQFFLLVITIFLTACANQQMEEMDHSHMILQGSSDVPSDLKVAENPTYPVGSKAKSKTDHMGEMMMGVEVEIVGAYETTAYVTSYTPSDNAHPRVENHKWIIHEELIDVGEETLQRGEKAKTSANHMMGMEGTEQEIISSTETTVYMVNFTTPDGQKATNHKWLTEEELEPL
ncbi:DUF1541 domain-containing protein [Metabacillus malikii]|uniref:DUF1541 domain-containing protein n=1 Tax=Metabacillus malikii TaxID=1504265 RepID=A0ABT9ZCX2_9BACI|nr:DUF1541 domain-containing protein [Metabacillus malikii]MDQ0230099.1 hypothetical protein [Metabacillus malikii]